MAYRVFVSCSIWPQDFSVIEPFRELIRLTGKIPWTVGIDEQVENDKVLQLIVRRIKESAAMIVIHTRRYSVDGYLPSLWLQREPVIATMNMKPVLEFYERGIREESLLGGISINQIPFDRFELRSGSGRDRIKKWL